MGQKIELKSIKDLLGMKFFIPSYQRGYRWTEQQVKDLIDDIYEFQQNGSNGIYCIQPLVVKGIPKEDAIETIGRMFQNEHLPKPEEIREQLNTEKWEVIDGQQRLTTIYILLSYLQQDNGQKYSIEYETRKESNDFLENIKKRSEKASSNIDFFHMDQAHNTIKYWFKNKEGVQCDRQKFLKTLNEKVQFIWYETDEPNPIRVFTRLNIGKIALTDAELIKALFLNRSNFGAENMEQIRLQQVEIAAEWDRIEYTLQNDEFWLFIHDLGWPKPTRIDFIFDLMREQDGLKLNGANKACIGNDERQTFRYFYEFFKLNKKKIQKSEIEAKTDEKWHDFRLRDGIWKQVKEYFQIFEEWYNDLELYHYIGYLVTCQQSNLSELVKEWKKQSGKPSFLNYLKSEIKNKTSGIDLCKQYKEDGSDKRACRPILLLHNIQTVINQNKGYTDKYKMDTFNKFPFHLLKKEKWDVEHINSNTENSEEDIKTQQELLLNIYLGGDDDVQEQINEYFNKTDTGGREKIFTEIKKAFTEPEEWSQGEKNKIWNYTLLDSSTNRSYGNTIFSGKRRIIIGKDMGKLIAIPKLKDDKLAVGEENNAQSSFVPTCTKQVFLKYYSPIAANSNYWTKEDAKAYLQNINDVLSGAGFIDDKSQEIEDMFNQNQN